MGFCYAICTLCNDLVIKASVGIAIVEKNIAVPAEKWCNSGDYCLKIIL